MVVISALCIVLGELLGVFIFMIFMKRRTTIDDLVHCVVLVSLSKFFHNKHMPTGEIKINYDLLEKVRFAKGLTKLNPMDTSKIDTSSKGWRLSLEEEGNE